jgi:hypothetical protein
MKSDATKTLGFLLDIVRMLPIVLAKEKMILRRMLDELGGECDFSGRAIASSSMFHFARSVFKIGVSVG